MGKGTFRAEPPPGFERDNLRRMLNVDVLESDFRTAVVRFTDDTFDVIGKNSLPASKPVREAERLAEEFEPRLLKETDGNISARLAVSILNQETPGFFVAQFDKGKRGRFTFLLDYQSRVPVAAFGINAGEKGLIFAHRVELSGHDIWMAFYGLRDYERGSVDYSDSFDLVATPRYRMDIDLLNPKKMLGLKVGMDFQSRIDGLRAIPLAINESLSEYDSERLKKAMRVGSARMTDGTRVDVAQEDWEGGFTLFLPAPRNAGEEFSMDVELEGEYMFNSPLLEQVHYPRGTGDWYPRHGYLNRSTYDLTFHHRKRDRVALVGAHVNAGEGARE